MFLSSAGAFADPGDQTTGTSLGSRIKMLTTIAEFAADIGALNELEKTIDMIYEISDVAMVPFPPNVLAMRPKGPSIGSPCIRRSAPPLRVRPRTSLKLPRFRGHRHICVEGVHDVEIKTSLRP
jgi:hypothetical protein